MSKEGNRSREGYAEGLGMQNCSRKLPEGPGPTHSLAGRVPKARDPEGSQMLTTGLSLCGLSCPEDVSWAFLFGLCRFWPHLISAMGPQESGSSLKQNGMLDYYESTGHFILEPHPRCSQRAQAG